MVMDRENLHLSVTKVEVSNRLKPMIWLANCQINYLSVIQLFKIKYSQFFVNYYLAWEQFKMSSIS